MRMKQRAVFTGLFILFSGMVPVSQAEVRCLFDEESGFPGKLFRSAGASVASVVDEDAFRGKKCLNVTPELRGCEFFFDREFVWDLTIAEKPVREEYRYLLFAWKKTGGKTIQLGFRDDRSDLVITYYAGVNNEYKPRDKSRDRMQYIQVSDSIPSQWQYVIRDMHADLNGEQKDFMINGAYFIAGDGVSAEFDCIYLSNSRAELEALVADLKKGVTK